MNKYIAKHSIVTNLGAIVFFLSWILMMLSFIMDLDQDGIRFSIFIYMILGGAIFGVGLLNEL